MVGLRHEKTYGILFLCTVMLVFQGLVTYFFLKLPAGQGNAKVSLSRKLYIENAKKEENRRSKMVILDESIGDLFKRAEIPKNLLYFETNWIGFV